MEQRYDIIKKIVDRDTDRDHWKAYDPEVDDGFFSSFGGETDHRESEMK